MKIEKFFSVIFAGFLFAQLSLSTYAETAAQEALNPGRSSFEQALELKDKGQFLEAERKLKDALELEPANPDYHFELANVYAASFDSLRQTRAQDKAREMLALATSHLSQTVMLQPAHLAAQYNLGILYKRAGRFEEAREQFKKVLALDSNNVNAMMQIGAIYEEQGFFDEARDSYKKAKQMNYSNTDIDLALEDLEEHEDKAHKRMMSETSSLMGRRGMHTTQSAQDQVSGNTQNSGAAAQALPSLGALLLQQFMQRRGRTE